MKLGDVANVRSGLVLSRKKAKDEMGIAYPLLNFRSIGTDGDIDRTELDVYCAAEVLSPDYVSRVGDVVVRLTSPYTAALIDQNTANMVISSNFVIIRVKSERLLPEYLFWLLNTRMVKNIIYENATSNMLGAVKPRFYTDFDIKVAPLEEQRKIAEINLLAKREAALLKELAEEKEKFYSAVIEKIHKRGMKA